MRMERIVHFLKLTELEQLVLESGPTLQFFPQITARNTLQGWPVAVKEKTIKLYCNFFN